MCFHPPSDIISPKMIIFCGFELEKSNWVKHKYTVGEPAEGSLTLLTIRDVNFTRGQK